jgi:hypothetical protein
MKQIAIAITALGLLSASTNAQKISAVPQTQGVTISGTTVLALGFRITGPGVSPEIKTENGQGLGIEFGYGFTPRLQVFASADLAKQRSNFQSLDGNMGLAHIELGARLAFPQTGRRAVPYLSAQIGGQALGARSIEGESEGTIRIWGTHVGGGAGVLYALSPALAIDAGVIGSRGKFGKAELLGERNTSGDVDVNSSTTVRLKVGFTWHP